MIKEKAAELGIPQAASAMGKILHRLLFASINEACKILEEGKAYPASDIDVMWLNGFGFPRYRGGPMYWGRRPRRRWGVPPNCALASARRRALGPRRIASRRTTLPLWFRSLPFVTTLDCPWPPELTIANPHWLMVARAGWPE